MPRTWHDRHAVNKIEDESQRELYRKIVADKKPYFMRYIYPDLMKRYNTYIRSTDRKARREFLLSVEELKNLPYCKLTNRQKEFLHYYDIKMPVGVGDCVVNKICRIFEREFDGYIGRHNATTKFNPAILKSPAKYTSKQFYAVKSVYENYKKKLQSYLIFADYERIDSDELSVHMTAMSEEFMKECHNVCSNGEIICNILVDICYARNSTKKFAWEICGDEIIQNLLAQNSNTICFPARDATGDIEFGGEKFSLRKVEIKEDND